MSDVKSNILTSFTGGEITPGLSGRVDYEELRSGVRYVSNFLPEPQGGLKKFYGTRKIGTVASSGFHKMIPFNGASEPIALLFINDGVLCVTNSEVTDTGISLQTSSVRDVSYAQQNDVIKFTSETGGMSEIRYYGIVAGQHVFKYVQPSFKEVPYFPLGWNGLYHFAVVSTGGETGTITLETASGNAADATRLDVPLPPVLVGAASGKNILTSDPLDVLFRGYSDANATVSSCSTVIKFFRRRNGADTELFSASIGNTDNKYINSLEQIVKG